MFQQSSWISCQIRQHYKRLVAWKYFQLSKPQWFFPFWLAKNKWHFSHYQYLYEECGLQTCRVKTMSNQKRKHTVSFTVLSGSSLTPHQLSSYLDTLFAGTLLLCEFYIIHLCFTVASAEFKSGSASWFLQIVQFSKCTGLAHHGDRKKTFWSFAWVVWGIETSRLELGGCQCALMLKEQNSTLTARSEMKDVLHKFLTISVILRGVSKPTAKTSSTETWFGMISSRGVAFRQFLSSNFWRHNQQDSNIFHFPYSNCSGIKSQTLFLNGLSIFWHAFKSNLHSGFECWNFSGNVRLVRINTFLMPSKWRIPVAWFSIGVFTITAPADYSLYAWRLSEERNRNLGIWITYDTQAWQWLIWSKVSTCRFIWTDTHPEIGFHQTETQTASSIFKSGHIAYTSQCDSIFFLWVNKKEQRFLFWSLGVTFLLMRLDWGVWDEHPCL